MVLTPTVRNWLGRSIRIALFVLVLYICGMPHWFCGIFIYLIFVYSIGNALDKKYNPFAKPRYISEENKHIVNKITFSLAGYIARGNGAITEEQVQYTTAYLDTITSEPSLRKEYISDFKEGASSLYSPENDCIRLRKLTYGEIYNLRDVIDLILKLIFADGRLDTEEANRYDKITSLLGFNKVYRSRILAQAEAMANFRRRFNDYQQNQGYGYGSSSNDGGYRYEQQTSEEQLNAAYAVLEIPRTATAQEAKKAYLKLMKKYHPDRVKANGGTEEMRQRYTEKCQTIQQAYDVIQKHLGA